MSNRQARQTKLLLETKQNKNTISLVTDQIQEENSGKAAGQNIHQKLLLHGLQINDCTNALRAISYRMREYLLNTAVQPSLSKGKTENWAFGSPDPHTPVLQRALHPLRRRNSRHLTFSSTPMKRILHKSSPARYGLSGRSSALERVGAELAVGGETSSIRPFPAAPSARPRAAPPEPKRRAEGYFTALSARRRKG